MTNYLDREYRILLIDDDDGSLLLIQDLLAQFRDTMYVLQRATSLEQGVKSLQRNSYDACLVAYRLGDSSGLDLLERTDGDKSPIIMLTDENDLNVDLQALQLGAADYLSKDGLTAPLLERVLRNASERFQAEEQRRRDESHLRLITSRMPAVLWTTDTELRFTSSLGAGLLGLGLQSNEVVGVSLAQYLGTENDNHPAIAAHRRALCGDSVSFEIEWLWHTYQCCVEPLCDGKGRAVGTIGIALDVTDQRKTENDLAAAREIQRRLLPEVAPRIAGFDIAGICRPAQAIGGDFFDYIPMRDDLWGIVVADVSSHGFAPALIMTETRRVLRTMAEISSNLQTILAATNRAIIEDTAAERFVTLFFSELNPRSRAFRYIGAGHEGYLFRDSTKRLESTTLALGIIDGLDLREGEFLQLQPGDLVAILTDGFTEARATDRTMFGTGRTLDFIQHHRDRSSERLLNSLYDEVCRFCHPGRPQDDMTAVIVKVLP